MPFNYLLVLYMPLSKEKKAEYNRRYREKQKELLKTAENIAQEYGSSSAGDEYNDHSENEQQTQVRKDENVLNKDQIQQLIAKEVNFFLKNFKLKQEGQQMKQHQPIIIQQPVTSLKTKITEALVMGGISLVALFSRPILTKFMNPPQKEQSNSPDIISTEMNF